MNYKPKEMPNHDLFSELCSRIFRTGLDVAHAAITTGAKCANDRGNDNGDNNGDIVCALVAGICSVSAPLSAMANFISNEELSDAPVTADMMLFAAILVCHVIPTRGEGNSYTVWDPLVVSDSIMMFEKLRGYSPDSFLAPPLVNAARMSAADAAELRRNRVGAIADEQARARVRISKPH